MLWTERAAQGEGDVGVVATIRGVGRFHKILRTLAILIGSGYGLFLAITLLQRGTVSLDPGALFCGIIGGLMPLVIPLYMAAIARRKGQFVLGPAVLVYAEKGFAGSRNVTLSVADIHGFGYQRSPTSRFRWEVAAIMRSGTTMTIPLPTVRKEDARWVARRLNAALAHVQAQSAQK